MSNYLSKESTEYAQEAVNGITSLYLPESDVLVEPVVVENAPKMPMTFQVHKYKRLCNKDWDVFA